MRYVFIINPVSGGYSSAKIYISYIKKYCRDNSLVYSFFKTEYRGHATKIARTEAESGDEIKIYGFGGDGTLHEIVEGVLGFDNAQVGIFAFGSGNDYIRAFTKNEEVFRNVAAQLNGEAQMVDVIKSANGRYALNQCALGLDAKVAMHMEEFKGLPMVSGPMAYNISVLKCAFSHFGIPMHIVIDDKRHIDGEFMMALVANGPFYGGGYEGAPKAKLDDGLLDIVLIKKVSRMKFAKLVGVYKSGKHLEDERFKDVLTYIRCKKIDIKAKHSTVIAFDGECSKADSVSLEIMPAAIKFIVPKLNEFSFEEELELSTTTV